MLNAATLWFFFKFVTLAAHLKFYFDSIDFLIRIALIFMDNGLLGHNNMAFFFSNMFLALEVTSVCFESTIIEMLAVVNAKGLLRY